MIATVLLIGLAIAGTVTLYTTYDNIVQNNRDVSEDLVLNPETVNFESCWNEGGATHISARNVGSESLNTTPMNVFLDGQIQPETNYTITPDLVDPQQTMEVELSSEINSETQVKVGFEGNTVTYRCAF